MIEVLRVIVAWAIFEGSIMALCVREEEENEVESEGVYTAPRHLAFKGFCLVHS